MADLRLFAAYRSPVEHLEHTVGNHEAAYHVDGGGGHGDRAEDGAHRSLIAP
jgi:hypothetical protein